jgi:isoquinoline 1-oxidoreductase beta subunit
MADKAATDMQEAAPAKRKGVKRRAFLIGGVAVVGAGLFGISIAESNAAKSAKARLESDGGHSFATWLKIGEDDSITIYSPHTDIGQGSNTGLAQMLAEELDAAWGRCTLFLHPPNRRSPMWDLAALSLPI